MLCPRCGSKIKNGKICKVCGYELKDGESTKQGLSFKNIVKLFLSIFFLYYGYQLLKAGNVVLGLFAVLVMFLYLPILNQWIPAYDKINKHIRRILVCIIFVVVGVSGVSAQQINKANDFINKYQLQDEFEQIGIDDISSIEVERLNDHPDYPSVGFKLINTTGSEYSGSLTGDSDGNYKLLSFRKYEDGISKEYYESNAIYNYNGKLDEDLYDYKTDQIKKKRETEEKVLSRIVISSGEINEYAIELPMDSGNKIFYKLPANKSYRVTRESGEGADSVSYIWQDYDEQYHDGDNVSYKNYDKYEFANDDTKVYINMVENTHLDLTGDYTYIFETYE